MEKASPVTRTSLTSTTRTWAQYAVLVVMVVFIPCVWVSTHLAVPSTAMQSVSHPHNHTVSRQHACAHYFRYLSTADPSININHHPLPEAMATMRIFSQCYLQNASESAPLGLEAKVIPFLEREFPVYTSWDGTVLRRDVGPQAQFWRSFRTHLHGRGIVVGCDRQDQLPLLVGLIRALKALGNTLPIQIVHSVELPVAEVVEVARTADHQETVQDVWFVNAASVTTQNVSIRAVAATINSFAQMVYMDPSTVPLVPPHALFDDHRYASTGLLFFKESKTHHRYLAYKSAYDPLLATRGEMALFGTARGPRLSSAPAANPLLYDDRLYEGNTITVAAAGLYVVNRAQHFMGSLIEAALELREAPANHQHREHLWLSHIVAGTLASTDLAKAFNRHYAAVPGLVVRRRESYSVCGPTQFHYTDDINGDLSAVWANRAMSPSELASLDGAIIPSSHPFTDITHTSVTQACASIGNYSRKRKNKVSVVSSVRSVAERLIWFTPAEKGQIAFVMDSWGL